MSEKGEFSDQNILSAEFCEDQDGIWGLYFLVKDGAQESFFTEPELLELMSENGPVESEYEFIVSRLQDVVTMLREGSVHMAMASLLADISRIKGILLKRSAPSQSNDSNN